MIVLFSYQIRFQMNSEVEKMSLVFVACSWKYFNIHKPLGFYIDRLVTKGLINVRREVMICEGREW